MHPHYKCDMCRSNTSLKIEIKYIDMYNEIKEKNLHTTMASILEMAIEKDWEFYCNDEQGNLRDE